MSDTIDWRYMRLAAAFCVALGLPAGLFAAPQVPRPAPEFAVALPGGKQILLSQLRGKVVLLEFLFTTCPHCQHEAGLVTNLYKEFGPKGFEPVGVAVNSMAPMLVPDFVRDYRVGFPVGSTVIRDGERQEAPALNFLGVSMMERWVVPQVVLIDRKGMIRYQTPALGAEEVQNEAWLRGKIQELLKEPPPRNPSAKRTAPAVRKRST